MSVIKHTSEDIKLLARLMRAEAEGDGQEGMLMVGNVGVNRVRADCLDFRNIINVRDMVFQSPGGFEATHFSYFYKPARSIDIRLAKRVLNGETFSPATRALWFYNPFKDDCKVQWYGQFNSGRYKSHCFYSPLPSENCF